MQRYDNILSITYFYYKTSFYHLTYTNEPSPTYIRLSDHITPKQINSPQSHRQLKKFHTYLQIPQHSINSHCTAQPHAVQRSPTTAQPPRPTFFSVKRTIERSVKKGRLFERSEFLPFSGVPEESRRKKSALTLLCYFLCVKTKKVNNNIKKIDKRCMVRLPIY